MKAAQSRLTPYPITAVLGIAALSWSLSVHASHLDRNPFDWGLMYANAYDLLLGRMPYRETYEYYGLLSSAIFAMSMLAWGKSMFVMGIVAGAFYAVSLVLTFFIWRRFIGEILALLVVIVMFCVHSHIESPWSNYLAYTFLLAGILTLIGQSSGRTMAGAGVWFGLSMMARHSFALIILPAMGFRLLTEWRTGWRPALRLALAWSVGCGLVLTPFALYLFGFDLGGDFKTLSVSVNQALLETIESRLRIAGLGGFLRNVLVNLAFNRQVVNRPGDARTLAFSIAMLSAALTLAWWAVNAIRRWRTGRPAVYLPDGDRVALIAVVSICGLSQATHIYTAFRLATASGLALGLPFFLMRALLPRRQTLILVLSTVATCGLLVFALPKERMTSAPPQWAYRGRIEAIQSKYWPEEWTQPYDRIASALETARDCGLTDLINLTVDPLVPYLVPAFHKSQREPSRASWHRSDLLFPDEVVRRESLLRDQVAALVLPLGAAVPSTAATYAEVFEDGHPDIYGETGIFRVMVPERCRAAFPGQRELKVSLEYYQRGQYQEAAAAAKAALVVNPSLADAYNNLAASYANIGMVDEGVYAARAAIRLRPDFQLARNNLAWLERLKTQANASTSK